MPAPPRASSSPDRPPAPTPGATRSMSRCSGCPQRIGRSVDRTPTARSVASRRSTRWSRYGQRRPELRPGRVPGPGRVHYVLERNDLSPLAGAPTPLQVHVNLSTTPGLRRVASFGPGMNVPFGSVHVHLPSVEIYEVRPTARTVVTAPVSNSVVLSGGAQGLLALDQLGLDPGNRAVILAGDGKVPQARARPGWTRTPPRVSESPSVISATETYVLTPGQPSPLTGKPAQDWTIVPGQAAPDRRCVPWHEGRHGVLVRFDHPDRRSGRPAGGRTRRRSGDRLGGQCQGRLGRPVAPGRIQRAGRPFRTWDPAARICVRSPSHRGGREHGSRDITPTSGSG